MSLAPDFLLRFRQYAADAQAVNRPPNVTAAAGQVAVGPPPDLSWMRDLDLIADELTIAKREGIACIVDAGHADMGRDIGASTAFNAVGDADRGKRWLLRSALLSRRDRHEERGADRAGADRAS
jgi:hypothetical protein